MWAFRVENVGITHTFRGLCTRCGRFSSTIIDFIAKFGCCAGQNMRNGENSLAWVYSMWVIFTFTDCNSLFDIGHNSLIGNLLERFCFFTCTRRGDMCTRRGVELRRFPFFVSLMCTLFGNAFIYRGFVVFLLCGGIFKRKKGKNQDTQYNFQGKSTLPGIVFCTACVPNGGWDFVKNPSFLHWRVPIVGNVEKKCTLIICDVHARK